MDDTLGRIYRVDAPVASPGNCGTCGNSQDSKGFITFDNLDFEFYGTLYFCSQCVRQIANAMGYAANEEFADLTRKVTAQEAELAVLREAQLLTEQIVDNLQHLTAMHGVSVGDGYDSVTGSFTDTQLPFESQNPIVDVTEGAGPAQPGDESQPGIAQSSDEQGPVYLRNTASTESADALLADLGL